MEQRVSCRQARSTGQLTLKSMRDNAYNHTFFAFSIVCQCSIVSESLHRYMSESVRYSRRNLQPKLHPWSKGGRNSPLLPPSRIRAAPGESLGVFALRASGFSAVRALQSCCKRGLGKRPAFTCVLQGVQGQCKGVSSSMPAHAASPIPGALPDGVVDTLLTLSHECWALPPCVWQNEVEGWNRSSNVAYNVTVWPMQICWRKRLQDPHMCGWRIYSVQRCVVASSVTGF